MFFAVKTGKIFKGRSSIRLPAHELSPLIELMMHESKYLKGHSICNRHPNFTYLIKKKEINWKTPESGVEWSLHCKFNDAYLWAFWSFQQMPF